MMTNETSWVTPPGGGSGGGGGGGGGGGAGDALQLAQAELKQASTSSRTISITLYLTGCKPDEIKPDPAAKPGSTGELINALLSTTDAETGEPYIVLKAGRPMWDKEFTRIGEGKVGGEPVGVIFCGAPAIAAALKDACEKHSKRDRC
eukprot:2931956-Prymnesium_polylepis.1